MPTIQQEWFIPFIVSWVESPTILPWSGHLETGGDPVSLPLWGSYVYFPFTDHCHWLGIIDHFFAVEYFTSIGFRVSLFGADILLLLLLLQIL